MPASVQRKFVLVYLGHQVHLPTSSSHYFRATLIRRLRAGNPDRRENLQCICETCHGYKLQANHRLCLGDKLGYLEILRNHHFDVEVAERALALVGLQPSPKKNTD